MSKLTREFVPDPRLQGPDILTAELLHRSDWLHEHGAVCSRSERQIKEQTKRLINEKYGVDIYTL